MTLAISPPASTLTPPVVLADCQRALADARAAETSWFLSKGPAALAPADVRRMVGTRIFQGRVVGCGTVLRDALFPGTFPRLVIPGFKPASGFTFGGQQSS